jgi:hypothetical protein
MYSAPVRQDGKRITDKHPTFIGGDEVLRMTRDHILVKPLPSVESPIIDCQWDGAPTRGTVIAVGPGCYPNIHNRYKKDGKDVREVKQSKHFRKTEVKAGDVVELGGREIGGYLFTQVMVNNELHIIAREQDVCFIDSRDSKRRTA